MTAPRRHLLALAVGAAALASLPARAGSDEDAVARSLEAFRRAQAASDAGPLMALSAPELSYGHSNGNVEDRATFVASATSGKARYLSLEFRNPVIGIVGATAIVRYNWVAERELVADGSKTATNLYILMVWQKQGDEWKLIARGAGKAG
ncbi:nuclear transport factor 2 family protein [Roseateles sp. P5_E7]